MTACPYRSHCKRHSSARKPQTNVATTAPCGRCAGRINNKTGTRAIQPSGPQSRGGKLAQNRTAEMPATNQAPRERVLAGTERAAEMIARTVGSFAPVSSRMLEGALEGAATGLAEARTAAHATTQILRRMLA